MRIGVIFPQTEIGSDPGIIREYTEAVESLGYDHLLVFDHVLGVDTGNYPAWSGVYRLEDQFHEPFVLFGYMAAITKRIELTTGIVILPQRQTALVAKQAAEVDVLTNGRLRLGIGIGWNHVEYEALGENFHNRGVRSEEQIVLMRKLWTEESVNFSGKWHTIPHAGLNPMPVQQPIPIWLGGGNELVLKRIGRIGDGWISNVRYTDGVNPLEPMLEIIHSSAEEAGRNPKEIGIESWISARDGSPYDWVEAATRWKEFGSTHISLNTMGARFTPEQHIDAVRRFKEALN